jgi:predicted dithiol-disulfide oxidoreductase (DUF899 family)
MTAIETTHAVFNSVVTKEEWLRARRALLEEEKALTRRRDELSRKRRELPWVEVEKNYVFEGPEGPVTLADLFAGRSQLIVYHFMFSAEMKQACPSCSLVADNIDPSRVHLADRDVALAMVSRAPIGKIEAFRQRMGWTSPWVSSNHNAFNRDYHVSFTPQEMATGEVEYNFGVTRFPSSEAHGVSVFYKDAAGRIFHTYSAYARGAEGLVGTYDLLDMAPKGRDEDGLPHPMAWIRHHDRYETQPAHSCCTTSEHV